jgi:FecR protein
MSQSELPEDVAGRGLRRRLSAWCDSTIDTVELATLQADLAENAEARQIYFAYMDIHAGIHDHVAGHVFLDSLIVGGTPQIRANDVLVSSRLRNVGHWLGRHRGLRAIAALLLVMLYVVWKGGTHRNDTVQTNSPSVVAHVSQETQNCEWFVDHTGRGDIPRNEIRAGETIRITRGQLKLIYDNGTVVTLHSPAIYNVRSSMLARVWLGKLTAKVAKGAEGFTFETPRANVIDLGTEFGIEVNDNGATDVVVFKGEVDLNYLNRTHEGSRQQRLSMGEGVHLDSQGTASRIVSITNGRFSDDMVESAVDRLHPIVISSVRDNVRRNEAWNYYEIVHAGMGEDVLAYVDRIAHQYNGVDASGMPSYLLGGDYVKMFNNDKVNRDIRISVTVAVPARVFVLLDKRLEAPHWLRENFRDTGDTIGVDTGPFFSKGQWNNTQDPPGVGPGESVEDILAIWERDVKEPCVIHLGATEAPESGPNMYGIVAVPLGEQK